MEGAKLCHLRDLQKACATLEGEHFTAWVDDHKAWYAPLVPPPKSKDKRKKLNQKRAPNKKAVPESLESSESSDEDTNTDKRVSSAAPGAGQGRGCPREKPKGVMPVLSIETLISKNLVHHVRWSEEVFQGYTRAGLQIGAANFKQMEKIVDRNVSEAPAFAACMRCIVSVHCLCTSSRLQVPACNDPTSPCRGHCHTRVCAEWLYWVQALINIRSVCKAALSGAAETEKEKVFVDLQKRGEDKTVLFGGPIFWACAVAADTESDTVFELVCQIPTYIDTPSNKKSTRHGLWH
jgi:hypothetical protein